MGENDLLIHNCFLFILKKMFFQKSDFSIHNFCFQMGFVILIIKAAA
ncbi:hypothetical protein D920_01293 [Enterococcus faecalis 13-SD-W-01]|nr:hypothetical protein D920_01293 [Enterococcus faecalis 13-SD-W-01]